jgi:methylenetetrahydrofolate dehydrogenase (NADP+)/methenyltetrahydrofolate cyclohydrolase
LLDGKALATKVRADVADAARAFAGRHGRAPALHFVLVGDDPASAGHVQRKTRTAAEVGISGQIHSVPASISAAGLVDVVGRLSDDASVDGILVQLPLPEPFELESVLGGLDPAKDVDGLHPVNVAALCRGTPQLVPCTPAGVLALIELDGDPIAGKRALVIGRSELVGRPTAALLVARDATVTIAHSKTRDLGNLCREADIVVAAAGRARLVGRDWVKPGAVVIDVGINRDADGKLCGDVDFEAVEPIARAITPVPGGVGPMTIAQLLANTVRAATARLGSGHRSG